MPLLKKINKNLPDHIYGTAGMLVIFKNGIAKVNQATADHFGQIPGFEVEETPGEVDVADTAIPEAQKENITQPEPAEKAPTETAEIPEITIENFEALHWMTQKKLIEQGKVPVDVLMFVAEHGVTQKVRDAANVKLGR